MERYSKVLKRLYQTNKFKKHKVDLSNMLKASSLLGDPHKNLNFIHVTGTNGKGTVTTKCAKVLEHAGYKSGLFISPHLLTFRERIQINGKYIEQDFVGDYLDFLFKFSDEHQLDLTYFEYITLMAFEYYKQKQVDIVSLEVGMGGRLDATNIIDPLVSIIVSIGLDHVETLGPTVYDIASKIRDLVDFVGEKAGIIKPGRPAVVGPFTPIEIFQERANEVKSDLTVIDVDKDIIRDFDIENSRIAEAALRILADKYTQFQIPEEAYEKGLKAKQPMRLEYIDTNTLKDTRWRSRKLILDVGHNPPAIYKSLITLYQKHPNAAIRVVYGTSAEKDSYESLQQMLPFANKIHLVHANHPRAMKIEKLTEQANFIRAEITEKSGKNLFEPIIEDGNIAKTIDYILNNPIKDTEEEIVIFLGSFYIMAETRACLGFKDETDPFF